MINKVKGKKRNKKNGNKLKERETINLKREASALKVVDLTIEFHSIYLQKQNDATGAFFPL